MLFIGVFFFWRGIKLRFCVSESTARLAQSVERKTLNLVVVGSSPTLGVFVVNFMISVFMILQIVLLNVGSRSM